MKKRKQLSIIHMKKRKTGSGIQGAYPFIAHRTAVPFLFAGFLIRCYIFHSAHPFLFSMCSLCSLPALSGVEWVVNHSFRAHRTAEQYSLGSSFAATFSHSAQLREKTDMADHTFHPNKVSCQKKTYYPWHQNIHTLYWCRKQRRVLWHQKVKCT